jgi:hypothetical protein
MSFFTRLSKTGNLLHDAAGGSAPALAGDVGDGPATFKMHRLSVGSSDVGGGSRVKTHSPMEHELIHRWNQGDEDRAGPARYARVQEPHKVPYVVAGSHDMQPGDHVKTHDDGNGTTRFGFRSGSYGEVTHVADTPAEMKAWPKGTHSVYVLK